MKHLTVFLSPMAGFTNAPMRAISARFGAARTYTEMANAAGLIHKSDATWQLLETLPIEPPPVAHLYGFNPDDFAHAAELIASTGRFQSIDINAGCPVPKITKCGAGSALMRDPKRIGAIVRAIRSACDLPVSVKTRIGFNPSEITVFDILHEVEDAGAYALALHGRYKSQGHAGIVSFDIVADVKRRAKIKIFGNGGVRDFSTASEYMQKTCVDALLVGQGAIGHPWTFSDIRNGIVFGLCDSRAQMLSLDEIREVLFEHIDLEYKFISMIAKKYPDSAPSETPETLTAIRFRCHLFRYLSGLKGASHLRGQMSQLHTISDIKRAVDDCIECEHVRRERFAASNSGLDSIN